MEDVYVAYVFLEADGPVARGLKRLPHEIFLRPRLFVMVVEQLRFGPWSKSPRLVLHMASKNLRSYLHLKFDVESGVNKSAKLKMFLKTTRLSY